MSDRLQWRCLECRASLTQNGNGFDCGACGRHYPIVEGVPILVADPYGYLVDEIDVVKSVLLDGSRRRNAVETVARDLGLSETSVERMRDVIDTDVARAEAFFALLKPALELIETRAGDKKELSARRRSGWAFDSLLPNLLRDWTDTLELEKTSSTIRTALEHALSDPRGKSFVYAGCGAAGLLNKLSIDFSQVVGCDLTLPILLAARRLLDAKDLELELPRVIHSGRRVTLNSRSDADDRSRVQLLAMDALDMALADNSVDCILTCFLIDLLPDPKRLADEVHRILSPNGVWINYGPSGPVEAPWRFDQESAEFFTERGFAVEHVSTHRNTYFDLTRDLPSWSYRDHVCYLVTSRKAIRRQETARARRMPDLAAIPDLIPQHFPHASIVSRQNIGIDETARLYFRCEPRPGRTQRAEIGGDTARIVSLVDGNRTAQQIADLLSGEQTLERTMQIFAAFFEQGLLSWRDGRIDAIGA